MATTLVLRGIHLHNSANAGTPYNGSGTPWTGASTTPFELAMNEKTGPAWSARSAEPKTIYGGGAPFRSGSSLYQVTYENVTEQIPVQIRATAGNGNSALDNAIIALQAVRRTLKAAPVDSVPMSFQPNGAAQFTHYAVYDGEIVESASFINEEAGRGIMRCMMTITRSYVGGWASSGETLINAATFGNIGTGSPSNAVAYGAGSGDMIYEGQPLNIDVTLPSIASEAGVYGQFMAASVYSRSYGTASFSQTNASAASIQSVALTTFNATPIATNPALKPRVLIHMTTYTNTQLQLRVQDVFGNTAYTSPWVRSVYPLFDMGTFTIPARPTTNSTTFTYSIYLYVRSADGTNTYTYALNSFQYLLYYDFLSITQDISNRTSLKLNTFPEVTNFVCLPYRPRAYTSTDTTWLSTVGTFPRYWAASNLFLAWQYYSSTGNTYKYNTAQTATVTATHAPLYRSLRPATG